MVLTATENDVRTQVQIDALLAADTPRLDGENLEHVRMLAEVENPLPPILVRRETMRVIDGMHRLRAAMLRGERTIEVQYFEGDHESAFVRSVEANIAHGLPCRWLIERRPRLAYSGPSLNGRIV